MTAVFLPRSPDGLVSVVNLLAVTIAAVPDLRAGGRFRFADGWSEPVPVSLRAQAEGMHKAAFLDMVGRSEIVPRSPLTRVPWPDFEWRDAGRCAVSWADAQAFCRMLALDLDEAEPVAEPSQDQREADLLARFRGLGGDIKNGRCSGRHGSLADLARAEGRARQTLLPILLRAVKREAEQRSSFAQVAEHLRKK